MERNGTYQPRKERYESNIHLYLFIHVHTGVLFTVQMRSKKSHLPFLETSASTRTYLIGWQLVSVVDGKYGWGLGHGALFVPFFA